MNDKTDFPVYRELRQTIYDWMVDRNSKMVKFDEAQARGEEPEIDDFVPSLDADTDALILALLLKIVGGDLRFTRKQLGQVLFVLDLCYAIAKSVISKIVKYKTEDFDNLELVWLTDIHLAGRCNRHIYDNRSARWKAFTNRVLVDGLDE